MITARVEIIFHSSDTFKILLLPISLL